jgi:MazG family protein
MTPVTSPVGTRFERLVEIMRRLRAPDGCPWDRQQTHASLRPFVLEETYEVLEAIDSGTPADLCEELGDVLFEAVFLARLSEEAGDFTITDAIDAICDKLVRRHPHVFDRPEGSEPLTSDEVVERWEVLKAREREAAGQPRETRASVLEGVPKTLPALLRAYEVSARAASVGFDWSGPADVVGKIEEEAAELRRAVEAGSPENGDRTEEEMGDLLFAIVNLARKLGVEPESALRRASDKFVERFTALENNVLAQGRTLMTMSLDDMEAEWQRVKASGTGGR